MKTVTSSRSSGYFQPFGSSSSSVWIVSAKPKHDKLEEGRVYAEVSDNLLRPVIFWRDGGLLYYLVGDSLQDCDKAVQELRQAA